MTRITNDQFLKAIFGDMYIYAHVTSFSEDPNQIPNDRRGICWAGGFYKDYQLGAGHNQFYTVSLFAPDDETGRAVRRKANFSGTYVVGLDDVKEKLPLEQVQRLPPPSIIIKSSLYSEQWLYILEQPENNRLRLDNLMDQLIANGLAPDGNDPGMKGVTRYLRLPEGFNTKAKRVEENGGAAPQCDITEWHPERKYTMEQLAEPFGVDLDAERHDARTSGAAEIAGHPILDHLNIKSMLSPGRYDITCPWVHTHTDEDDSGTAIFTNEDKSLGFQCHHGHCQDKTANDVIEKVDKNKPGFRKELNYWRGVHLLDNIGGKHPKPLRFNSSSIRTSRKLEFKNVNYAELPYVKWVLNDFIAEGFICIAGLPGIGKSSSIMSLALVVAGFGDTVNANVLADRDRVVIYVSEDTEQLQRQLYGYCNQYELDAERLRERLKLVDARRCTLEELAEELSALIKVVDRQCQDKPLLILDTASSLFELENENDNSQVARFLAEIKNQIYELLGCPIWLITHAAKTSSRDASDITPRGASAYMGDVTGTASICEQHGQKVMTLGKTRVTPEYTEIAFESQIKTVFTVDDRDQPQTQSLWLVVPKRSSQEARKQQAESEKEKQSSLRIDDQAKKIISYMQQQLNKHEVITIKSGKGGSQTPPDELKAAKLLWNDVLTESLSFTPQTKDEKEIKVRVLTLFPTDKSSPNGWHVWSSKVPKGDKGFPKDKTLSNLTFLSGRGEH